MDKFETQIQFWKHECLKEVAKSAFNDTLMQDCLSIPTKIIPGKTPTARCCVYKERAILSERIKLAMGGNKNRNNVVEVIEIACDECPLGGYSVTDACRGCIAHRCSEACPKKAINFTNNLTATINKDLCINCGLCAKACPYSAIENRIRPCERICKNKCISPDPITNAAKINDEKCIHCGSCVYMCPFGAIVDESYIVDVINILKSNVKKVAVVAPSIGGNFTEFGVKKVISALKALGFDMVIEAALGADIVAKNESMELAKSGKLTSSCCPAFTSYIEKNYPTLKEHISNSLSPMATISREIKEKDPTSKIIFIGPCTAKKFEIKDDKVRKYVDSCLTFEEVQALFDAKEIDIASLKEEEYDLSGSYYGRGFAKCGGLTNAVKQSLEEENISFDVHGVVCSGIKDIKNALNDMKNNKNNINFIEGMMCDGGCIGGPCNLTHELKNKIYLDKYAQAADKSINKNINKKEGL